MTFKREGNNLKAHIFIHKCGDYVPLGKNDATCEETVSSNYQDEIKKIRFQKQLKLTKPNWTKLPKVYLTNEDFAEARKNAFSKHDELHKQDLINNN